MILKIFGFSFAVTAAVLIASLVLGGPKIFVIVLILAILEISLSFDNAVVNATVIKRMSHFWREIFLTIGILIAVFGMRLVFPLALVSITAGLGPLDVIDLALNTDETVARTVHGHDFNFNYSALLHEAHPQIAAFGGMFLLMIFLDFIFEDREITWIGPVERFLAKLGAVPAISATAGLLFIVIASSTFAKNTYDHDFEVKGVTTIVPGADVSSTVVFAGILGMITYLAVNALGELFEGAGDTDEEAELSPAHAGIHGDHKALEAKGKDKDGNIVLATGKAAFFLFLYLEVLDASFSFDGVIGAFAITSDIFVIAAGLGIGAMYIRSLTIYLVEAGTLDEYVHLEHGAHYAIGALAVLLFASIGTDIPEVVTGLIGVGFIAVAMVTSLRYNKIHRNDEPAEAIA